MWPKLGQFLANIFSISIHSHYFIKVSKYEEKDKLNSYLFSLDQCYKTLPHKITTVILSVLFLGLKYSSKLQCTVFLPDSPNIIKQYCHNLLPFCSYYCYYVAL